MREKLDTMYGMLSVLVMQAGAKPSPSSVFSQLHKGTPPTPLSSAMAHGGDAIPTARGAAFMGAGSRQTRHVLTPSDADDLSAGTMVPPSRDKVRYPPVCRRFCHTMSLFPTNKDYASTLKRCNTVQDLPGPETKLEWSRRMKGYRNKVFQ